MKKLVIAFMLLTGLSINAQKTASSAKTVIDTTRFVLVQGGVFKMGTAQGTELHETPAHEVNLKPFYIGKTEVTMQEYDKFCRATGRDTVNSNGWGRGQQPAIFVSWQDAIAYCNWLSEREKLSKVYLIKEDEVIFTDTGKGYRLPTEAEWEYAARGGAKSKETLYAGSSNIEEVAWYTANSNQQAHPVAQKKPNELGLYDMNGNVWEWVWDVYDWNYYKRSAYDNPTGPTAGPYRVMRGGAFYNREPYVHVTTRQNAAATFKQNSVGFRIARTYLQE